MKTCSTCGEQHELSFFNRDRSRQDGLDPRCKVCTRAACKRTYARHHEKHIDMKRAWKASNPERHKEINRQWAQANPDKARARTAAYRARRVQATPPWVDLKGMQFLFDLCPKGYHVDHIHPLCGETFCGLNVPWNLQFLPAAVHYRKGRKLLLAEEGPGNL